MTLKNHETFGRRIARMRLQHGMTQERLANIAHVSAQAVSKWENDQSYPDILLLPLLARTFGVTVDELLGAESSAPQQAMEPEGVTATVETPVPEPAPVSVVEVAPEPEPEPEPAPAPASAPALEPEPAPDSDDSLDTEGCASRIRLRVIREGHDAVNLTIPLVAARLVANVASYFPERLIEGVDIAGLFQSAQNAGKGTLIDVDDNNDHVLITLE